MKKYIVIMFSGLLAYFSSSAQEPAESFYEISAVTLEGDTISMSQYKGKAIVVVNTASKCGFTPQYAGLEELYKTYADSGLVILGFPCNQFAKQEPGSSKDIAEFCQLNYGVTFQMFEKIDVNGTNEHPIYTFLKSKQKGNIKWNFTKFLIDKDGNVVKRFGSSVKPEEIEADVKNLL